MPGNFTSTTSVATTTSATTLLSDTTSATLSTDSGRDIATPVTFTTPTTPTSPITRATFAPKTVFTTISSGPNEAITLTITSTSGPKSNPTPGIASSIIDSISTIPTAVSSFGLPTSSNSSGHGLTGSTRVIVSVVVPIVGVALIAFGLLFLWKRWQQGKKVEEARRKEVEEYGYNPNGSPIGRMGSIIAGSSTADDTPYDVPENECEGYRGWGSTNGGKKPSTSSTSGYGTAQPVSSMGMACQDVGHPHVGYVGTEASPSDPIPPLQTAPSMDGNHSNTPLMGSPSSRPLSADSSVIGAMTGPTVTINSGIHRGISNASSNYSSITHSDNSDGDNPASNHEAVYYAERTYEEGYHGYQQYAEVASYGMSAPVIRDVQARRNTRIETPINKHFPQQGNSGIAQNF